jgi:beta-lactam-binding protein with PASTA domain
MDKSVRSTSTWEYLDFELEIRKGTRRKYTVCVRSPEGEAQEEMRFPFDKRELKGKLKDLETAVLLSGRKRRRIRTPEAQGVQNFGQNLFQALLHGEIRAHYDLSLREAKRQNKGLRLKLRIQPPELAVLPWEFLYDPGRSSYLCLSSKTPLVRYLELREPIEQLAVSPPLKILGMVASPSDLTPLNVEHEKRRVEEAIKDLQTQGRVELTWLEGQTARDLQRAMIRGPWHIFHFIGHGGFDPATEEGLIALANEEGYARFLPAEDLAQLLKDHWDLRLVLLNSCEGARGSEQDAFSSTAATLVRPGIPAVLANQYEITDEAAIEFSRTFYEAVADGLPVDAAVAYARTSLKIEIDNTLEWATPVLYMRAPDGRIFNISSKALPVKPAQEELQEELEDQREEDPLRWYRKAVEWAWADEALQRWEVESLKDLANNRLGLSLSAAADIEREVMGDIKEAILDHQEQTAKDREEEEHRERLDELYAHVRQSHQDQEWQAVVDLFDQIHTLDSAYPDPEGLLASAREGLALMRRVVAIYDRGMQHKEAEEWPQALECLEEVQQLKPGYRETERLLLRVRHELAKSSPVIEVPDLSSQNVSQASTLLSKRGLKLGAQNKASSEMTPEGEIVKQSPEAGIEVEVGHPVDITVSSGSSQVKVPDLTGQSSFKARNMLTAAGLKLGDQIKTPNNDVPEGTIVKQYPAAGTKARWGSRVSIRFSSGPEKITTSVPDISGKDLEEAERLLSSAGLALEGSITQKSRRLAGTVISTDPPAGAEVDVGTAVTSIISSGPCISPAKPSFLPGRQESKPDFLPGKQKPKRPKLKKTQGLPDW